MRDPLEERSERRPVVRAVLTFAAAFLGFQVLFVGVLSESAPFRGYLALSADLAARLLRVLDFDVQASGSLLVGAGGGLGIERGCDALQPIALLVLAVLCFRAPPCWKVAGVLGGSLLLLALNLVRIASLYVLHHESPDAFATWHTLLWPTVFVLVTLLAWSAWAMRVPPARRSA